MDKDKQINYTRRVSQANKTELVVITYDIILDNIADAEAVLASDVNEYRKNLKQAQRFLGELMRALDYQYELSKNLLQLYSYVQRILVASDISGTDKGLESAKNVISGLRKAFNEIAAQDSSGSVMENTQAIFAGLTYGRGSLNETDMNIGSNRGFLA
ncbi:MAG: flagellar protein FliS [Lachnospiraceae bacterium]|nr:flagellar protein FliS [Lachnospiraceae bacterium]